MTETLDPTPSANHAATYADHTSPDAEAAMEARPDAVPAPTPLAVDGLELAALIYRCRLHGARLLVGMDGRLVCDPPGVLSPVELHVLRAHADFALTVQEIWPTLEESWPQLRGYAADWSAVPEAFRVEAQHYYWPRMQDLHSLVILEHRPGALLTDDERTAVRLKMRELIDALGPDLSRQVRDSALAYVRATAQDISAAS